MVHFLGLIPISVFGYNSAKQFDRFGNSLNNDFQGIRKYLAIILSFSIGFGIYHFTRTNDSKNHN
jgi:hypothetical protein